MGQAFCCRNISEDMHNTARVCGVAMCRFGDFSRNPVATLSRNLRKPHMTTLLLAFSAASSLLACILLLGLRSRAGTGASAGVEDALRSLKDKVNDSDKLMRDEFVRSRQESGNSAKDDREELRKTLAAFEKRLDENAKSQQDLLRQRFEDLLKQLHTQGKQSLDAVKDVRETVEKQLTAIREDNGKRLEEMRKTVDEKLQDTLEKRLGESFKLVSERLELVHKGLGEMQNIASGVGDLKKVLTNVKTKGILGEYQLANIIEQLLPREQYAENVATRPGSTERVEFAVRMPGNSDDEVVWLPIDSKFPLEGYQKLINARDDGNQESIAQAEKALAATLEKFAKDISEKYLEAPYTTDFGVMFLPIEASTQRSCVIRVFSRPCNANTGSQSRGRRPCLRCSTVCKWASAHWL